MDIVISEEVSKDTVVRFINEERAEEIKDFEGKKGKISTRYEGNLRIIMVGAGEDGLSSSEYRDAVADAVRLATSLKVTELSIEVPDTTLTDETVEGAILGEYIFDKYLSEKSVKIDSLELLGADYDFLHNAKVKAEAVNYARDLVNENADIVTPEYLASEATKIAHSSDKIKLEILTEHEIQSKDLGLLWAVGKGSQTPPRLIIMSYNGDKSSNESIAVVGKGVTFDTGGLNLKPSGSMESMRHDMAGAAVTLATMKALAELEPEINIVGVVTSAQNAISNSSYYPGDIITGYDGTTVEVLNTDAEGRLCLADAISYTKENYNPTKIINLATLTGAVVIALGDTISGLFSNDKEFANHLFESGEESGESLWELPIRDEHREAIKSSIADLQNISKKSRNASSITAAAFLEHFVGETPWCHLDIAGTSWSSEAPKGIKPKFATGFGVRVILEAIL